MNINTKTEGSQLTIALEGRLDTGSAPQLEGVLKENLRGVTDLVMDFQNLAYISSAGLRERAALRNEADEETGLHDGPQRQ